LTDTKVIGAAVVGGREYVLLVSPVTDGTASELTVRDNTGNLKSMKDILAGKVMTAFWLTIGTPSDLDLIQFKGDDGGIIYEWGGCIDVALGHNPDVVVEGISAPITPGCAFEVNTSD
jgi:hypothetical protein